MIAKAPDAMAVVVGAALGTVMSQAPFFVRPTDITELVSIVRPMVCFFAVFATIISLSSTCTHFCEGKVVHGIVCSLISLVTTIIICFVYFYSLRAGLHTDTQQKLGDDTIIFLVTALMSWWIFNWVLLALAKFPKQ